MNNIKLKVIEEVRKDAWNNYLTACDDSKSAYLAIVKLNGMAGAKEKNLYEESCEITNDASFEFERADREWETAWNSFIISSNHKLLERRTRLEELVEDKKAAWNIYESTCNAIRDFKGSDNEL